MSIDSIAQRNAANAQYSTGPRTPEGKAVSSHNAEVHGYCSVEPRTPEDRMEAQALFEMYAAEMKPKTPMEIEVVRDIANADQRRRRIGRAIEEVGHESIGRRSVERLEQIVSDTRQAHADVQFWEAILARPPVVGEGLRPAVLNAVLDRFNVNAASKYRPEDRRGNLVQFHHVLAQGDELYAEATLSARTLAEGESLKPELAQSLQDAQKSCQVMTAVFEQALAWAQHDLTTMGIKYKEHEARPRRDDDWFDDSKRTQLLRRYHGEAERAYYRAFRSFDAIRRRQDAERRQIEREARQVRKAAQDAEKAARQAARQAEITAKANPPRNEMVARVVAPMAPESMRRNEPKPAPIATQPESPELVTAGASTATATLEAPRVVYRRGKAVTVDGRRPPEPR